MTSRDPIAFLSYVRSDDRHDGGRITTFRERLEGEVRMQTGRPFAIFQDRNDIAWSQRWAERISETLDDVTFLIPILSPSFFQSPACRSEFETFLLKERTLGVNRLILPLYYVDCDELGEGYVGSDEIAGILRARNWTDWRPFRFKNFDDENVATALAKMAGTIKASIKELDSISATAAAKREQDPATRIVTATKPPYVATRDIRFMDEAVKKVFSQKKFTWAYEREWRILGNQGENHITSKKSVARIYFGSRMTDATKTKVLAALEKLKCEIRQMAINHYDYSSIQVRSAA